jgi:hypothetical protein
LDGRSLEQLDFLVCLLPFRAECSGFTGGLLQLRAECRGFIGCLLQLRAECSGFTGGLLQLRAELSDFTGGLLQLRAECRGFIEPKKAAENGVGSVNLTVKAPPTFRTPPLPVFPLR